ncbi:MAG: Tryptophan synthase alpha chain, partial [uncultured Acidimicrobiales bacterium]
ERREPHPRTPRDVAARRPGRRPQAAPALRHRRPAGLDRCARCLRRGRRRRHRGRHSVLGSGDGRAHDPGSVAASARRRCDAARRPGCARRARRRGPPRGHDVLQRRVPQRSPPLRSVAARQRGRRRHRARPVPRGAGGLAPRRRGRWCGDGATGLACDPGRPVGPVVRAEPGLHLRRGDHGGDGGARRGGGFVEDHRQAAQGDHRQAGDHRLRRLDTGARGRPGRARRRGDRGLGPDAQAARRSISRGARRAGGGAAGRARRGHGV